MIPLHLTLKYFLSYQDATLDFAGLHTACICGANGAGKSSLLEGMTWALWGKSRAASDDDVIQTGADHVRVDFTFQIGTEVYRVIRSGNRGRSGGDLQFQIQTAAGSFRAISAKGKRATQTKINETLKITYDTFTNSIYLRQGYANAFMQSSPSERKKVLADLLKLEKYETLAAQAKDTARQFKIHREALQGQLTPRQAQLTQRDALVTAQAQRVETIATLTHQQKATQKQYDALRDQNRDRDRQAEQLQWQQTQFQRLLQDTKRLTQEQNQVQQQVQALQQRVDRQVEITQNYEQRQQWQTQQHQLAERFQADQAARHKHQQLSQQLSHAQTEFRLNHQRLQAELEQLAQQEQDLQPLLTQAPKIQTALEQLKTCRQSLQDLEHAQLQAAPLQQRRQSVALEIGQVEARFRAQWESLGREREQLEQEKAQGQALHQQLRAVDAQVDDLDKKKVYQERITHKAQGQRSQQDQLTAQLQTLNQTLVETEQTWQRLQQSDAHCPLCEQALTTAYRQQVLTKTQQRQDSLQQQMWVLKEQIADCEHQQEQLQTDAAELTQALNAYDRLVQERGHLEAKLDRLVELQQQIWDIEQRSAQMQQSLDTGEYALDLQQERANLENAIAQFDYDEQRHSQLRTQERELRWADVKNAKLQDAQRNLQLITERRPQLQTQLQEQEAKLANLTKDSPLQQQIQQLEQEIQTLGYDGQAHQELLKKIERSQTWELDYQNLQQAQHQLPELLTRQTQLQARQTQQQTEQAAAQAKINELVTQLDTQPDHRPALATLEQTQKQQQQQLADLQMEQGKTAQQLTQLQTLATECEAAQERLQQLSQQHRVYQELAKAFGKNGIQALMIENLLPQLEAETNRILARLTGNQLHVQFVTQRATKASRSRSKTTKMIDTLDILIADAQGTRPYETYSGGEAFRINFAIRLALAKLLAQRSGAALQMLIIDEGFGTQDTAGCDRLIAAINAIASDFACILAVTHIPQFKEAFNHRIEVIKTDQGSQIHITN